MTTYFDRKAAELRGPQSAETLATFESALLADMVLVCEVFRGQPDAFPEASRMVVYEALRKYAVSAWHEIEPYRGPSYENNDEHRLGLASLVEALHVFFHAAKQAGWRGGDSPEWPRNELLCRFVDSFTVRAGEAQPDKPPPAILPHVVAALRRARDAATVHDSARHVLETVRAAVENAAAMIAIGRVDAAIDLLTDIEPERCDACREVLAPDEGHDTAESEQAAKDGAS